MKLLIDKSKGTVSLYYPAQPPKLLPYQMLKDPSEADLAIIKSRKPSKWVPADLNVPEGPGSLVEITPEPTPRVWPKLVMRRRLRALGKEEVFDAFLDSSPSLRKDWDDCVELVSTDPMFVAHADAVKSALGMTDEEWAELLQPTA